jgi:G3E family GTPase
MVTEIYVISGFLGAGKTTLIQKLLKEAFQNEKIILIENDFGEISVDAALLKSGSIEVKEINSGCICCSLSGDFVKALKEVLDRFHPDKIIIEPSGVGKLSDIVKCCSDPRISSLANVKLKLTVADVKRCKMYLENFGEFFEDQIINADTILLSRTDDYPDRVEPALKLVRSLNAHSVIISKSWETIDASEILYPKYNHNTQSEHISHGNGYECRRQGAHTHTDHEHHGDCNHEHHGDNGHNHSAEDVFDTVTIRTKQIFVTEDLKARILAMERNAKGTILRAKGIVRGTNGYINLQYLPGDVQISNCSAAGDVLCIIGHNLNRQELCTLFSGE